MENRREQLWMRVPEWEWKVISYSGDGRLWKIGASCSRLAGFQWLCDNEIAARVAKLADARDLKSRGPKGP